MDYKNSTAYLYYELSLPARLQFITDGKRDKCKICGGLIKWKGATIGFLLYLRRIHKISTLNLIPKYKKNISPNISNYIFLNDKICLNEINILEHNLVIASES